MQHEPFGSVTRVTLSAATEIRTHGSPSQPFWLRWMTLLCESKQNVIQTRQFSSLLLRTKYCKKRKNYCPVLVVTILEAGGLERFLCLCVFFSADCFFYSFFFFRVQNGEKQPHFSLDNIVDVHCGTCTKHSVLTVVSG